MRTSATKQTPVAGQPRWSLASIQLFEALRFPNFRFYWLATLPWNFSRWVEIVVSGWLMFELTNSPWQVALLGFCRSLALPLVGVFAGVVADRVDRLRLVRGVQIMNTCVALSWLLLVLLGLIAPWHLYAGGLLLGLGWALDWPARRALMADMVAGEYLVKATVLENLSMNITKIIGPAMGGVLLWLAGPAAGFLTLTLAFGLGGLMLLRVQRPAEERAPLGGSALRNLTEGLGYVTRDRAIFGVLAITVFMNFFAFPYIQLLPVFAKDVYQAGELGLGWLGAANGIGAMVGLPLIARMRAGAPQGWVFILGSALMSGTLLFFALSPWYTVALFILIVGGIGHAGFGTMQSTIILSQAAPEYRGRALGVLTLAIGSSPFGALAMGFFAEIWSAPVSVALCGSIGVLLVGLTALLLRPLRRAGRSPVL